MPTLSIEKIKELNIPINIRKRNNYSPASQGLVLYNDSVNLYGAIALVLDELGGGGSGSDEAAQDAVGSILLDTSTINFTYDDSTPSISAVVIPGGVDHDSLLNWVANKHIDHSTVSILAGTGLSGGGDITASRTLNLANTTVTPGTYGSATQVGRFTVDAQGRLTAANNVAISVTSSSITDLTESISDSVAALLVAGSGISLNYNDVANTLTISATNAGTVTSVAASQPVSGFTISGSPITGSGTLVFTLNNDLLGLENISTLGMAVRTATNTWSTRTIAGTFFNIAVTNGDGILGHPTINLVPTNVTAGTYGSAAIVPTYTVDDYGRLTDAVDVPIAIASSQVINFNEDILDLLGTAIVAGTNITVTYNDLSNTIEISSTAGSGTVTGSGGPYQVAWWDATGVLLTSDVNFIYDGTNLAVNTPTAAINSIFTTKGISTGALAWGYSHLNSTDSIVFSVADNGTISIGDASADPITISTLGIERNIGYYLGTSSGNLTLVPNGIVYVNSVMGINTTSVGSNKLAVDGAIRFNLGSDLEGDIFYRGASGSLVRLPVGSTGQVLLGGTTPSWGTVPGGGLPTGGIAGDIIFYDGTNWTIITPVRNYQTGLFGSTVILPSTPVTNTFTDVYLNGFLQELGHDYSIAGAVITFTTTVLISSDRITTKYFT